MCANFFKKQIVKILAVSFILMVSLLFTGGLVAYASNEPVEDFESASSWGVMAVGGGAGTSSFTTSTTYVHEGTYSGKFHYDFSGAPSYIQVYLGSGGVGNPYLIAGEPDKLQMWVYGNNTGHKLTFEIIDNGGETYHFDVNGTSGVNWSGWKKVSVALDSSAYHFGGDANGEINYPVKFSAIIVQRSNGYTGSNDLYFDNLDAITTGGDNYEDFESVSNWSIKGVGGGIGTSSIVTSTTHHNGANSGLFTYNFTSGVTSMSLFRESSLLEDQFFALDMINWVSTSGWAIEAGQLSVNGGEVGLSKAGAAWTDYNFEFDLSLVLGHLGGWFFRAPDANNGYMFQLEDSTGTYTPNQLRIHKRVNGAYTLVTTVPTGMTISSNTWYRIRMELVGSTIKTYINGTLISTWTDSTFQAGKVGFRASTGEHFHVDNVMVYTPKGKYNPREGVGHAKKIGMWVKGNNSGHKLYVNITDKFGETFVVDMAGASGVNWSNWKWVEQPIDNSWPASGGDGIVDYPVEIDSIKVTPPAGYTGTNSLYFDNLMLIYDVEELVESCENVSEWAIAAFGGSGNPGQSSFTIDNTKKVRGTYSGKFYYDNANLPTFIEIYRGANGTGNPYKLAGHPWGIGVWVYGNNSGHMINAQIMDAGGEVYRLPLTPGTGINWSGWKHVIAQVDESAEHWGGDLNGKIDYPISLTAIEIWAPSNWPYSSTIWLDDIAGMYDAPSPKPITYAPNPYFNLCGQGYRVMTNIGSKSSRFDLTWADTEYANNMWNWSAADIELGRTKAAKRDWLPMLGYGTVWSGGGIFNPPNNTDWADFVTNVVNRYKADIHYYEFWNEPDGGVTWTGTAAQFKDLMAAGYNAAKAADPTATVLMSGLDGGYSTFLTNFLAAGGGANVDVYNDHPYGLITDLATRFDNFKSILNTYGQAAKPIWWTEANLSTYEGGGTEAQQASWIMKAHAIGLWKGVQKYFVYQQGEAGDDLTNIESGYGLLRSNRVAKAALIAYDNLVKLLYDKNFDSVMTVSNGEGYKFKNPTTNKYVYVLWANNGSPHNETVTVASGKARVYDMLGYAQLGVVSNLTTTIYITENPTIIEEF